MMPTADSAWRVGEVIDDLCEVRGVIALAAWALDWEYEFGDGSAGATTTRLDREG
jgi:hypothetical protein